MARLGSPYGERRQPLRAPCQSRERCASAAAAASAVLGSTGVNAAKTAVRIGSDRIRPAVTAPRPRVPGSAWRRVLKGSSCASTTIARNVGGRLAFVQTVRQRTAPCQTSDVGAADEGTSSASTSGVATTSATTTRGPQRSR